LDTPPTDSYTLSLHDALPICSRTRFHAGALRGIVGSRALGLRMGIPACKTIRRRIKVCEHPDPSIRRSMQPTDGTGAITIRLRRDRKSTRLNSSHVEISYAVF